MLKLLHLCDSLFPIGSFGYSDGLESAISVRLKPDTTYDRAAACEGGAGDEGRAGVVSGFSRTDRTDILRDWMDVCLDETIGRFEGPIVWRAHRAFDVDDLDALTRLDEESIAMRPSVAARKASRAMGHRLLTTWAALYPHPRLAGAWSLPVAFGCVSAAADVDRRSAVEAFAYTRLASTASAAMRLLPIGQTDTHRRLARALDRVPAVVDGLVARDAEPETFSPLVDIAVVRHQYMHSRLFRT